MEEAGLRTCSQPPGGHRDNPPPSYPSQLITVSEATAVQVAESALFHVLLILILLLHHRLLLSTHFFGGTVGNNVYPLDRYRAQRAHGRELLLRLTPLFVFFCDCKVSPTASSFVPRPRSIPQIA
ncbi:unnamed protein product [Pleuronectes platessa]|uniref:Uncharacterized protein n=1 Tax=Pleuronectes platessa TaxID=8262 RepID=A0A9N7TW32_PLEPL|nr:unnamed protein product [Pleuronectes platessa]